MTKQQFLDRFYIQADKVATLSTPGYEPSEISLLATEALEQWIITRYGNYNKTREGFEETEKRAQDLGTLIKTATILPQASNVENLRNGRFFELPNTLLTNSTDYSDVFWFSTYEEAIATKANDPCFGTVTIGGVTYNNAKVLSIRELSHEQWAQMQFNPFQKPTEDKAIRLKAGISTSGKNYHELIFAPTVTPVAYRLRYIRRPSPIDLTTNSTDQLCELAEHTHREILEETIKIAYKDTGRQQEYQIEQTNPDGLA